MPAVLTFSDTPPYNVYTSRCISLVAARKNRGVYLPCAQVLTNHFGGFRIQFGTSFVMYSVIVYTGYNDGRDFVREKNLTSYTKSV